MAFVATGRRPHSEAVPAPNLPMRGLVDGLPSPRPLGDLVPAALQEDDFCQRMLVALDENLAPIFNVLDCFDSYLDANLAPPDFVDWLGSWVGVDIDETWGRDRRREFVQHAVVLYRIRGTLPGLAAHIRSYCGVTPDIEDNGACTWSQTADSPIPGSAQPRLTVRLQVEDPDAVRRSTVSRIVDSSRPAHLPYSLEIHVGGKQVQAPEEEADAGMADENAPGAVALPGSEHIELAPQAPVTGSDLEAREEASPEDGEATT